MVIVVIILVILFVIVHIVDVMHGFVNVQVGGLLRHVMVVGRVQEHMAEQFVVEDVRKKYD